MSPYIHDNSETILRHNVVRQQGVVQTNLEMALHDRRKLELDLHTRLQLFDESIR